MANITLSKIRYQHCTKSPSDWGGANSQIVPLKGELLINQSSNGDARIKVGDGIKRYNELPFINVLPSEYNPPLIQYGRDKLVTGSDNVWNTMIVNFPIEYAETPVIFLQCNRFQSKQTAIAVSMENTKNFTVGHYGILTNMQGTDVLEFSWVAIGKQK